MTDEEILAKSDHIRKMCVALATARGDNSRQASEADVEVRMIWSKSESKRWYVQFYGNHVRGATLEEALNTLQSKVEERLNDQIKIIEQQLSVKTDIENAKRVSLIEALWPEKTQK